ncbi:hypothetical protein GCM10027062_24210 [Nocardioides hungaricus]
MAGVPVEDRLAIQELFARYTWALDTNDGAAVAALFVEDGEFDGSAGSWRGADEIASMVSGAREGDGDFRSQHWTANSVYHGGADRCEVVSMSIAPAMHDDEFRMSFMAYYVDMCVKRDGQWLFERRRFRLWDGQGALAVEFFEKWER